MTREEAIDELQKAIDLIKQNGKDWLEERDIPILQMAITALELSDSIMLQLDCKMFHSGVDVEGAISEATPSAQFAKDTNVPNNDCISRQAAIDIVWKWFKKVGVNGDICLDGLRQLPSTQPVAKDTNVPCTDTQPKNENEPIKQAQIAPNDDLISRKTAIDAVHEEFDDCLVWDESGQRTADEFEIIIDRLPSAQPDRGYIEQIKWERDLAIRQLADLGYGLGEKPRTNGDIISRQAAIDAIGEKPFAGTADEYEYEQGLQNQWERDVVAIKILPSAQPEEVIPHRNYKYLSDYWCACGWHLGKKGEVKYCADCGRKVNWDEWNWDE